ncbi:leucine-rich repeat domain-containing protein [Tenacibaculum xiamenense]|uniref:leucine-rich repeat domain-containing protein n=1 Tax=Tenacibaculum xiamenense TaxID=1261553 RepID=UPI003895C329
MKKKYLSLFLSLCLLTVIKAQNVHIPDTNFKSFLVSNGSINTNGDSEIQVSEAEAFTGSISFIFFRNISDLTGIEAFKNIIRLVCRSNLLTSLDLSQNTSLEYLDCTGNNLTSLNVSQNTKLNRLICAANNLTSIDVSQNTVLDFLDCRYNDLTNLDVSQNKELMYLYTGNNELTSLDVSQNKVLTHLRCDYNELTSLNLKNGYNAFIRSMEAHDNENLTCILVDDEDEIRPSCNIPRYGWCKDDTASYSENCETASMDEVFNNSISIAPNPVNNQLTVSLSVLAEIKRVEVYSVLGDKILETKESTFDFSGFSKGVYLVKIESNDNKIALKKVIKN